MADSGKDRLGEKLRDLEHAREGVYFAARDRALIDKLRAETAWHAEVVDLVALARAVADGAAPPSVLLPNQDVLDHEAARLQEAFGLPGVRAVKLENR